MVIARVAFSFLQLSYPSNRVGMRDQHLGWILMGVASAISGGFNQWTCRCGHHHELAPDILSLGSKVCIPVLLYHCLLVPINPDQSCDTMRQMNAWMMSGRAEEDTEVVKEGGEKLWRAIDGPIRLPGVVPVGQFGQDPWPRALVHRSNVI